LHLAHNGLVRDTNIAETLLTLVALGTMPPPSALQHINAIGDDVPPTTCYSPKQH